MRKEIKEAVDSMVSFAPASVGGRDIRFFFKRKITNTQFIVLMVIFDAGKCTMSYIARRIQVSMPTVTGVVSRLIKSKLVKRMPCAEDRRRVYVELTPKGKAAINDFQDFMRRRWNSFLVPLSATEIRTFKNVIAKINRNAKRYTNETTK